MVDSITINPVRTARGSIRPPGSKSITNRALVCSALAAGTSQLNGALASDDTQVMVESLRRLGIEVRHDAARDRMHVVGCGGQIPAATADLFVGNSGTTIRFLTAMVALGQGDYRLDGVPRMRQRPIADLLAALNALGARAVCESGSQCPPVRVSAHGLAGGGVDIRGDLSSQFLSGLLMAAPYARQDVDLHVVGELVSIPYVTMTRRVMQAFGVTSEHDGAHLRVTAPQVYQARDYDIEPDASAASYFWAAAAITGGQVRVEGLKRDALQGDVAFCECLAKMGCRVTDDAHGITVQGRSLQGIDVNMNSISDTVQTLAAVALFAQGPTTIRDVAHIRHKETDRIGDLARELRKIGAEVTEQPDGLTITPRQRQAARIDTYDDHRMAMSLALVGLKTKGIVIRDPDCTRKTYPRFFQDLEKITVRD